MRTQLSMLLIAAATVTGGCVRSLHPIYTEETVRYDAGLAGQWVAEDDGETWAFEQDNEQAYSLVYTDSDGKKGCFQVHRTEIDGAAYLDLYAMEPELDAACYYMFHLMPVHTFMSIKRDGDRLTLACADPDWFEEYLDEHPDALAHEPVDDSFLVTARSEALRDFIARHAREGEGFGDPMQLTRRTADAAVPAGEGETSGASGR